MLFLIFSFIVYVLITSATATGVILIMSFFIKPFGLWLVANVSTMNGLQFGAVLLIVVYWSKHFMKKLIESFKKSLASKALKKYCEEDIKATMEAIKANESISKRREQLLKENKDLVKKYMNGDLPLSKEVKEALKKYPDGEENFK